MNGIKHLYVGDTNSMNVLVIRDMDTDTAAVVEWDLSDDEIKEIADKFTTDQNDESWYADEPEWEDWETVRDRLNNFWNIMDYFD
jgi:broad specificity phosphatase PhoE